MMECDLTLEKYPSEEHPENIIVPANDVCATDCTSDFTSLVQSTKAITLENHNNVNQSANYEGGTQNNIELRCEDVTPGTDVNDMYINESPVHEPTSTEIEMSDYSISFSYKWDNVPRLLCSATKEYEPNELYENFTKGCQWSPDGTCLLVPSEDFRLRVYELPRELYSGKVPDNFPINFVPALTFKEGGTIYDSCWYPSMSSWNPITCCFLSASKESPVHLWDAFTGKLRATYRAYNQVDEVEAPISVQFVQSGGEVWCGFKNAIRTFNVERSTRQTNNIEFKKDFPNAKGLVSCIRENPMIPGLVAFGTYSKCIGLYKDGPLCTFRTDNGVTQIEFSPCGTKLYSALRRSNEFLCWDLRNPGVVLYSLQGRQSDTNQRIQFAMTLSGDGIVSGGTDGKINIWDLSDHIAEIQEVQTKYKIDLSNDCVNGTSLHRSLPILATSTGQRICDTDTKHRNNGVHIWWVS